ncbi:MAG: M23 family metallopeptidase [Bacteroidota bacterium]
MSQEKPQLRRYYITNFLSQFHPFTFWSAFRQLWGHVHIRLRYSSGLPDKDTYTSNISYALPFEGAWMVVNGGSNQENSHSWDILTQRYAYDFFQVDESEESFSAEGKHLTDYYCFETPVLSPAAGTVVQVRDGVRDYKGVGDYSIDWRTKDFRGNFVVIQHGEEEFSFLAHLKKNSLMVTEGDLVQKGQLIGLCGNSGHSTEPHIHFHLQDRKDFWTAMGLPIRFETFYVKSSLGNIEKTKTFIERGQQVGNTLGVEQNGE